MCDINNNNNSNIENKKENLGGKVLVIDCISNNCDENVIENVIQNVIENVIQNIIKNDLEEKNNEIDEIKPIKRKFDNYRNESNEDAKKKCIIEIHHEKDEITEKEPKKIEKRKFLYTLPSSSDFIIEKQKQKEHRNMLKFALKKRVYKEREREYEERELTKSNPIEEKAFNDNVISDKELNLCNTHNIDYDYEKFTFFEAYRIGVMGGEDEDDKILVYD